jgi:hypothetical protein
VKFTYNLKFWLQSVILFYASYFRKDISMGSSVSCTRNTKVIETAFVKQEKSERKIEDCTETVKSSSHCLKSDPIEAPPSNNSSAPPPCNPIEAPPSNNILVPPLGDQIEAPTLNDIVAPPPAPSVTMSTSNKQKENGDDKDAGTENSKDKGEAENGEKKVENEWMTDEELEEFRKKTFDYLRDTANEVVALKTRHQSGGAFVTKIYNATIRFMQSYFALKKTVRENIHKFRKDIAELMMETKYFNLSCEIVMYIYKNGWCGEDGKEERSKTIPLTNSLITLLNFSDGCDEYAIGLANEPGFLDTLKQILGDSLPKYFAKEGEPKLSVSGI